MPGNLQPQEPTLVMPMTLASSFTETTLFDQQVDEYADGRATRRSLQIFPRHGFRLTRPLTDLQLADLRGFYFAYAKFGRAFWFYNQRETIPVGSWDPTGEDLTGRYAVVWEGGWNEMLNLGRNTAQIVLREVPGGGSTRDETETTLGGDQGGQPPAADVRVEHFPIVDSAGRPRRVHRRSKAWVRRDQGDASLKHG